VKLTRNNDRFVFHLGPREKRLLLDLLEHLSVMPSRQPTVSRNNPVPDSETAEELLKDSLAEHRGENIEELRRLFADPRRFQETPAGCDLSLTGEDVERLLQTLNEIRVGSWTLLGCPDESVDISALTPEATENLWSMEMTGYFQMGFLRAFERRT
jgi:hypothetical protein